MNDKGTENGVDRVTTYACFGGGRTTVNVPLAKEFAGGNTTGIQVQNVDTANTRVTLEYKSTSGTLKITEDFSERLVRLPVWLGLEEDLEMVLHQITDAAGC